MKTTNRYTIEVMECDRCIPGQFYKERFIVDNVTGKQYELSSKVRGQEVNRPMIDVEVYINDQRFFGHTEKELIKNIIAGESTRPAIFVPWTRQ